MAGRAPIPLADVNNDSAEDLAYTIAKSLAFPMNNWFLELTGDSGQLVLLVNPMWASRLGETFPQIESFQEYLWENAWQPIDLFRPNNQQVLHDKGRVDATGRVRLAGRPDQFVPVVCGGLGGLHAVALTSFVQSELQSVLVARTVT